MSCPVRPHTEIPGLVVIATPVWMYKKQAWLNRCYRRMFCIIWGNTEDFWTDVLTKLNVEPIFPSSVQPYSVFFQLVLVQSKSELFFFGSNMDSEFNICTISMSISLVNMLTPIFALFISHLRIRLVINIVYCD